MCVCVFRPHKTPIYGLCGTNGRVGGGTAQSVELAVNTITCKKRDDKETPPPRRKMPFSNATFSICFGGLFLTHGLADVLTRAGERAWQRVEWNLAKRSCTCRAEQRPPHGRGGGSNEYIYPMLRVRRQRVSMTFVWLRNGEIRSNKRLKSWAFRLILLLTSSRYRTGNSIISTRACVTEPRATRHGAVL